VPLDFKIVITWGEQAKGAQEIAHKVVRPGPRSYSRWFAKSDLWVDSRVAFTFQGPAQLLQHLPLVSNLSCAITPAKMTRPRLVRIGMCRST